MNLRTFLGDQHGFRIIAGDGRDIGKRPRHIHVFTDKDAAEGDSAFGNLPGAVRQDGFLAAVFINQTQGGDEHGGQELIRILCAGPGRVGPAVPAVGHGNLQGVFFLQQVPDVIALHLKALAVFRPARGEDETADPAAVEHRLIDAVTGHFQRCGTEGSAAGKKPAEHRHHGGRSPVHPDPGRVADDHDDILLLCEI